MSNSITIANAFGKAARSYDEHAAFQRHVIEHMYPKIKERITPYATLLDAGCGTGYFQEVLRKYGHKNTLTQMDMSPQMCDVAKQYAAVPEFATTHTICCDIRQLPFPDQSFTIVFSSLTLQWVKPEILQQTLEQLIHTIKPGGTLAITTIGSQTLQELASFDKTLVNSFISEADWKQLADTLSLTEHQTGNYTETLFYNNSRHLLRSIKGLGANQLTGSQKPRNKEFFSALEDYYKTHYAQERGLPATWQALTLIGRV